jgi:hypothetical protein
MPAYCRRVLQVELGKSFEPMKAARHLKSVAQLPRLSARHIMTLSQFSDTRAAKAGFA